MKEFIESFFKNKKARIAVFIGVFFGLVFYAGFIRPPIDFPTGTLITIEEGTSIQAAANLFEEEDVVQSSGLLSLLTRTFSTSGVHSGTYSFERKLSIFSVLERITTGQTGAPQIRVTIPEGSTTRNMAAIFSDAIPGFDSEHFRELAGSKEGYLFPETYIVAPGITEEALIALMEETFDEKIQEIQEEIDAFDASLHEVITMASLLEREARQFETKQKVAGILYRRIELSIPLQVDAVFGYIYDRDTFSPTFDELEIDSPYNTYENLGLPPGPIASPGLESIQAALSPIESPYLYYLTGSDGLMYYGRTFDEHVENRRFLR